MKLSHLNRLIHRWGSITIALPVIVVIVSGIILQLKKESAWIQPPTAKGSSTELSLSFDQILTATRAVPEAEVQGWEHIDRLDVRPDKGMVKVRCNNRWEVQLDTRTGDVLQVAYRRSDLIESLHDGSFFSDWVKLGAFLPAAIMLAILWGTGIYLFILPYLAKQKANWQAETRKLNWQQILLSRERVGLVGNGYRSPKDILRGHESAGTAVVQG